VPDGFSIREHGNRPAPMECAEPGLHVLSPRVRSGTVRPEPDLADSLPHESMIEAAMPIELSGSRGCGTSFWGDRNTSVSPDFLPRLQDRLHAVAARPCSSVRPRQRFLLLFV
jgi:hypothetical protein